MTVIKVSQPRIRNITLRATMRRFTQAERIGIRTFIADLSNTTGTRELVEDGYLDLQSSPNTQLDLPEVKAGFEGLAAVGLIGADRVAELLADGDESERYSVTK